MPLVHLSMFLLLILFGESDESCLKNVTQELPKEKVKEVSEDYYTEKDKEWVNEESSKETAKGSPLDETEKSYSSIFERERRSMRRVTESHQRALVEERCQRVSTRESCQSLSLKKAIKTLPRNVDGECLEEIEKDVVAESCPQVAMLSQKPTTRHSSRLKRDWGLGLAWTRLRKEQVLLTDRPH